MVVGGQTEERASTNDYRPLSSTIMGRLTLALVIVRCCFAEDSKEMYKDL